MKLFRKIFPFLLLILTAVACQRQSRIIEVLGLVENQPDSALQLLRQIDRGGLSDDELAEWGLIPRDTADGFFEFAGRR